MSTYKRPTVNLPEILKEALEQRAKEAGYASESAYFIGLFLFDIWCRREHKLTAKTLSLPPRYRDAIYAEAARRYLAGERAERGETKGWFEELVEKEAERLLADRETKKRKRD